MDFEKVLSDMRIRDEQDSNRAVAPLAPAPDAIEVDTTGNTLEKSVSVLKSLIAERLK